MLTFSALGRYGRFANGLFQIAGTIGLAVKHGYAFGFPEWKNHDHKNRFGSSEDIDLQKYFVNPLPRFDGLLRDFPVQWGYHDHLMQPGGLPDNVSLSGHFQSEKYFKHCLPLVMHYFTMKDEGVLQDSVAVHIRRGDYDNAYHTRIGKEYYLEAIKLFPDYTKFTVFSDDQTAATEMFQDLGWGRHFTFYYNFGHSYIEDFRHMKMCRGFICANSSYSLMAAILSEAPDKKIICPSNWFGPAWGPAYRDMAKDIYPEGAIIL